MAEPLDLETPVTDPLGQYALYFHETDLKSNLDIIQAREIFNRNEVKTSARSILSFGIGSSPVWIKIQAVNRRQTDIVRRLAVEVSWLDNIDVYFVSADGSISAFKAGDIFPFAQRSINDRYFNFDHSFRPGVTDIYLRVATPDPMIIPVFLMDQERSVKRRINESYFYGFFYGVIGSLIGYYLILYYKLRLKRFFFFSLYLLVYILGNMANTGHGFMWLWHDSVFFQNRSTDYLLFLFPVSGLYFATVFLDAAQTLPRQYKFIKWTMLLFFILETFFTVTNQMSAALLIAFTFVMFFTVMMVSLGVTAWRSGFPSAGYFLLASVTHATAASIAVLTVANILPYSNFGYHVLEVGMMFDAILLGMALADQFRLNQESRLKAEFQARIDPLTGIYNRRAFYELVIPLCRQSVENSENAAIILLDIDKFKSINDNYGHEAGDRVIVQVSAAVEYCIRKFDVMARWGGEEFIIFLSGSPLDAAVIIAERIRKQIESLDIEYDNQIIKVTASLGVAQLQSGQSLEMVIAAADVKLYEAKNSGRNRVCS